VGVALSDATATLASPLTTLDRGDDPAVLDAAVVDLVVASEVSEVVVGLPLNMDGSKGPAARAAASEADRLAAALTAAGLAGVAVSLHDERLTTVVADRTLIRQGRRAPARRKIVDKTAATVLLQSWLDGPGGRRVRAGAGGSA